MATKKPNQSLEQEEEISSQENLWFPGNLVALPSCTFYEIIINSTTINLLISFCFTLSLFSWFSLVKMVICLLWETSLVDTFQLLISLSKQFAPGSSSKVLITSANSRIQVVDGIDLVHKFKGINKIRQIVFICCCYFSFFIIYLHENAWYMKFLS